jgi:hypothetical protein
MTDTPSSTGFALFKDDIRISKIHSTRGVAMVEAFQRHVVLSWRSDFESDPSPGLVMAPGYVVKEINHG